MTTLGIIQKAKKELEKALAQSSNVLSKAMDTKEYQAAQIGRAVAFLEIAADQIEEQVEEQIKEADNG